MILQHGDTGSYGQGSAIQSGYGKPSVVDVFFYLGAVRIGAIDLAGGCFEYFAAVCT
jgi:hypothetical protein